MDKVTDVIKTTPGKDTPPNKDVPEDTPTQVSVAEYQKVKADADRRERLLKEAQERLAKIDEEKTEAERQKEIEAGNFKKVETDYKSKLKELADKLKQYEDAMRVKLAEMVKDLTEEQKRLIDKAEPAGIDYQIELASTLMAAKPENGEPLPRNYPGKTIKNSEMEINREINKARAIGSNREALSAIVSTLVRKGKGT